MKVVSITEVRQDATKLIEHIRETREPVLVCVRSRPAAYIVDAEAYDTMERDLKRLRYEAFWRGVDESEQEHRAGLSRSYDSAEDLIADLGPER